MANASTGTDIQTFNESTEANLITCDGNDNCSLSAFSDKTTSEMIQERMNTVQYFVCPILFIFGIIGNLCTILTVSHVQFHQMTSRFILCALAVSDSLLLLTNPFNQQFMHKIWNQDVRALSSEACKLFFVMYRTGKMSSSWFIVLVAVERFVAIMFPLKAKRFIRKTTVCFAIFLVYVAMFTLSGIWTFSTDIVNETCRSDVTSTESVSLHKSFVIVGATCYSIAPMILLLILTPVIIVRLYRSQRRRQDLHLSNVARCAKDTSRVSFMLIGIVFTYIICVTPITLVLILTFWTNEPFFSSTKTEYIILAGVAMSFEQINHSSNFFVYILCCRQFRQRFLQMVRCTKQKMYQRPESSTIDSTNGQAVTIGYIETNTSLVRQKYLSQHDRTCRFKIDSDLVFVESSVVSDNLNEL